jgi:hypothetical protein
MPWHWRAMKDVVTCDKLRIGGSNLRPGDLRMGQPNTGNAVLLYTEFIGIEEQTEGTETSKYLVEEKTIVISRVAASEKETV